MDCENKIQLIQFLRSEGQADGLSISLMTAKRMADHLWPMIERSSRAFRYAAMVDVADARVKALESKVVEQEKALAEARHAPAPGVMVVVDGYEILLPAGSTLTLKGA